MPDTEKVSLEQANAALQQLTRVEGESETQTEVQKTAEPSVAEAQPIETAPDVPPAEVAEDDLESLRRRNEELEASAKSSEEKYTSQVNALKQRNRASEQILRDRYLRKSTSTDKALNMLRATRSENGASDADIVSTIREIEGTMNPESASYVAPTVVAPPRATQEDQALVLNSFLNDQGMTIEESDVFGQWIRTEAPTAMPQSEQDVAEESLGGFLRLAHARWQQGVVEKDNAIKRNDAVGAVKSVQRTQKEAARAASSTPAAPKKQSVADSPVEVDVSKLTPGNISDLVRQSVEQYK